MANQLNTRGQPIAKKHISAYCVGWLNGRRSGCNYANSDNNYFFVKERSVSIPDKSKQSYSIADMRTG
ncbi:unnamed protein product [Brugia pahangi]|uniref:Uncharacterized protein n=1 Tax=Brugia pahangi TaxID=6280 RepID=A0A0N4TQV7_BRUPA|nr:unnamed protein product [Brugia pahangi]